MTATSTVGTQTPVLRAEGLSAGYGGNPVVRGINLHVNAGEIVGLLGANGAGKTTTLLALAGELRALKGEVQMLGRTARGPLHQRASRGLGFVTEEKSVIFGLNVLDNLRLGRGDLDKAFELFPELQPLRRRLAGTLSGGEQQILTFARALSRSPKVLLADELSLGLAPLVVERLSQAIRDAAASGVGILVVEQQARTALLLSHRAYVLRHGDIVIEGSAAELRERIDEIEARYLSE
jgi:branched-chain amino acid transport system ATP-binding protein